MSTHLHVTEHSSFEAPEVLTHPSALLAVDRVLRDSLGLGLCLPLVRDNLFAHLNLTVVMFVFVKTSAPPPLVRSPARLKAPH